jgi:hypothetical protein
MLSKRKAQSLLSRVNLSKNSFISSGSLASESPLPTSEAKSDTESELNLFTFPEEGSMTVSGQKGLQTYLKGKSLPRKMVSHSNKRLIAGHQRKTF